MWVKICANTNLEDALMAAEQGADAVGFVFAPSPRKVNAAQVRAITDGLIESAHGQVERIGVFPAWSAGEIASIVQEAGLTGVQLHGGVDPTLARDLRETFGEGLTVAQTLHWKVDPANAGADEFARDLEIVEQENAIDRILVDSRVGQASGGTGVAFDWEAAAQVLKGSQKKLIVAGGLTPENVAEAAGRLTSWGVDVASGVERTPGYKDPAKVRQFILSART